MKIYVSVSRLSCSKQHLHGSRSVGRFMPRRCLHCSRRRFDEQPNTEAATQTEAEGPPAASGTGPSPALRRWARLVRSIWNIRKLQRICHNTGERLKDFPKPLREEISKRFPKQ